MKVTSRDTDSLKPYATNPRDNDRAVDAVARSIKEFGWRQPIVIDGEGVIIVGHTRWKAAMKLGLKRVPVHVAADLTDAQKQAYRITDNQTADIADWNYELLASELSELGDADFDLEALGFGADQLASLLDPGLAEGLTDPNAVPEPADAAVTRPGDLYTLGDHRLLCGDAGKPADVDRLLDGAAIHLVNTDPPYNVKVEPRTAAAIAAGRSSFGGLTHHQKFDAARHKAGKPKPRKLRPRDRQLRNDYLDDAQFAKLLRAWFGQIARVLLPGRTFYIWGGYANTGNYPPALAAAELYFSQALIWVKQHPVLTRKDFMGNHEWCFYGWRIGAAHWFAYGVNNVPDVWEFAAGPGGKRLAFKKAKRIEVGPGLVVEAASGAKLYVTPEIPKGKHATLALADDTPAVLASGPPSDVWRIHKISPQSMIHLTEKPVELAIRAIQCSSRAGENVFDPFAGSGSTLIACEQTRRRCFTLELDPLYCDVVVKRWEQFTGRDAERQRSAPAPRSKPTKTKKRLGAPSR